MDVLIGVARLNELAAAAQHVRQDVLDKVAALVKPLPHALKHRALVESGIHAVNRNDAPRDAARAVLALIDRVRHGAPRAVRFDLAVKYIALAAVKVVLRVALVEKRDVKHAALVHGAQLHDVQPAAYPRQARRVRDKRADAHGLAVRGERDGLVNASVLVFSREI